MFNMKSLRRCRTCSESSSCRQSKKLRNRRRVHDYGVYSAVTIAAIAALHLDDRRNAEVHLTVFIVHQISVDEMQVLTWRERFGLFFLEFPLFGSGRQYHGGLNDQLVV